MALWSSVGVLVYSWREKNYFWMSKSAVGEAWKVVWLPAGMAQTYPQTKVSGWIGTGVLPEEHQSRNGVTKNASEALFGFFKGKTVIFMMWVWCLKASRSRMKMGCRTFIVKNVGSFWCTITQVWLHYFNIFQCGFTTLQYRFHRCSFWILLMVTLAVSKAVAVPFKV